MGEMLPLLMKNKEFKHSKYKEYLQFHKERTVTCNGKIGKGQFVKLEI